MYEILTKFIAQFDSAAFADAINTFVKVNPEWELHNYYSIIASLSQCEFLVAIVSALSDTDSHLFLPVA